MIPSNHQRLAGKVLMPAAVTLNDGGASPGLSEVATGPFDCQIHEAPGIHEKSDQLTQLENRSRMNIQE